MNAKDEKQQTARARKLFKKWIKPLWLNWWKINIVYYDDEDEFNDDCPGEHDVIRMGLMFCYADWQYSKATLVLNLNVAMLIDDDELENAVVQELCHVLVNEMQRYEHDPMHEEHVVSNLARAIMTVRQSNGI